MSLIQGRSGRVYENGKRVEPTAHPETRSRDELRASRIAQQTQQPSGDVSDINPFVGRFESRAQRRGQLWAKGTEGQQYKLEMTAAAESWDRERTAERAAADFAEIVEPMVQHALRTLSEAESNPEVTVAELENLRANVQLARDGNHESYTSADKAWRDVQRTKLEEKAHAKDGAIRELQAERDTILANAWGRETDPVPQVATPVNSVPVDRSKVAVRRTVATEHGTREVTEIVDV